MMYVPDFYPLRYSRPGLPGPGSAAVDKKPLVSPVLSSTTVPPVPGQTGPGVP
jgi:hypothetical protein